MSNAFGRGAGGLAVALAMAAPMALSTDAEAAPTRIPMAAPTPDAGQHRVVRGDTLWGIGRRYGISPRRLAQINGIDYAGVIRPGQVLRLQPIQFAALTTPRAQTRVAFTPAPRRHPSKVTLARASQGDARDAVGRVRAAAPSIESLLAQAATVQAATIQAAAIQAAPVASAPPVRLNPFGAPMSMMVALDDQQGGLGDVRVNISPTDVVTVDGPGLLAAVRPVLAEDAAQKLEASLGGERRVTPSQVSRAGLPLSFDPVSLVLTIRIPEAVRVTVRRLGPESPVASLSATGRLLDRSGAPLALKAARATSLDEAGRPAAALFTTADGRFGANGLAPGRWRIQADGGLNWLLVIPRSAETLYRAPDLAPSTVMADRSL